MGQAGGFRHELAHVQAGQAGGDGPQVAADLNAARQLIDILTMLTEKTKGNLTEDESEFVGAHLGELKLAYVQRSKSI